jgi:undecaprenyl-diphosphatase
MNLLEVIILAIVQGITEWLPISSSGHLVLVQQYLGITASVFFDVILHLGTLLAVLVSFRKDIQEILRAVFQSGFKTEQGKLGLYIIVGSIPTAIIGFLFQATFETFFSNLLVVGFAFIGTGVLLYLSKLQKNRNSDLNYARALLIGTAQGVALIPGISRSGSTISTGLLLKMKKEKAFQFSFLLFIPAVIGAALAEGVNEWNSSSVTYIDLTTVFLGIFITSLVSYFFLKLLLKVIVKEKFHWFAYYCWALGFLIIIGQIIA